MQTVTNDPLFRKSMKFCAWSGYMAVIFYIIGGVILGGMTPPLLNAGEPPEEFVRKLTENLFEIRVASIFMMISFFHIFVRLKFSRCGSTFKDFGVK
ncbi:MAG: hypothetical protein RBS10_01765 [Thauera propionica]|jgi:hypothetical protein|nr:hypothetical protein [Thauera propionica]